MTGENLSEERPGKACNQLLPDIPNLPQLCELFGVSADYLVRDEEETFVRVTRMQKELRGLPENGKK